jgi:hypothetical protein
MFYKAKMTSRSNWKIKVFLFTILVTAYGSMQRSLLFAFESSPAPEEEKANSETLRKLTVARNQHLLILLLIGKQSFNSVESEWKKVLDLKLGAKYEEPIAKSLLTISYELLKVKQFLMAQRLLDESLATVPFSDKNKSEIFACKAALYEAAGDRDSALKAMQKAIELEGKP